MTTAAVGVGKQQRKWQARAQLVITAIPHTLPPRWTVFDPITRQSYRIGWLEFTILTEFHRATVADQIVAKLLRDTPGLSRDEVVETLRSLQQHRLIFEVSTQEQPTRDKVTQSHASNTTARQNRAPTQSLSDLLGLSTLFKGLTSLLAVQIRGPNPEQFLRWLAPRMDFIFSQRAVAFWLGAVLVTCIAVLATLGQLVGEVDSFRMILQPATGGSLLLIVLATRCIHELGHAVVCTRHGIRSPDIGIYLFCGAPCLYCDVTESWRLNRRLHRASVAAAGVYCELIVAIFAGWLWMLTDAGTLHAIALKTMLVCSVGTILININPLLRFDGYYILADWLDESNLRQRADQIAVETLFGWLRKSRSRMPLARRCFYSIFSVSSFAMRISISIGLAFALVAVMDQWKLSLLGRVLAVGLLCSWWGGTAMRFISSTFRNRPKRSQRMLAAWLCVLVWCMAVVPLPVRTKATGWLEPQQVMGVYSPEDARLDACLIPHATQVRKGTPLFRLRSDSLELQRIASNRALEVKKLELRYALFREHETAASASQQGSVGGIYQSQATAAQQELAAVNQRLAALAIAAPSDGTFLADPVIEASSTSTSTTNTWADSNQQGRSIPPATRLGIVHGDQWQIVIPIRTEQLAIVRTGTRVRLRFHHNQTVIDGEVEQVVSLGEKRESWQHRPQSRPTAANGTSPQQALDQYAAIVTLATPNPAVISMKPGCSVDAAFSGTPTSLLHRFVWWMKSNAHAFLG